MKTVKRSHAEPKTQSRRLSLPISYRSAVALALVAAAASLCPSRAALADDLPLPLQSGSAPTLGGPSPLGTMGEAVASVDPSTGAAHSTFVFQLPAARGSAQPSLALSYSSSAGPGFAGLGWSLDIPSIERRGASGIPKFVDDVFGIDPMADRYAFAGKPLVPICTVAAGGCSAAPGEQFPAKYVGWTYFRVEQDEGMRFFFDTADGGTPTRWEAQTQSGVTFVYGGQYSNFEEEIAIEYSSSRYSDTPARAAVYRWNLNQQYDLFGNSVDYAWAHLQPSPEDGATSGIEYLTDIYDTLPPGAPFRPWLAAHHVALHWSPATPKTAILAQSPIWRMPPALTLTGVDVTSMPLSGQGPRQEVRRYYLSYQDSETRTYPLLRSITPEGSCSANVEDTTTFQLPTTTVCLTDQPTTFGYTSGVVYAAGGIAVLQTALGGSYAPPKLSSATSAAALLDLDGDSFPDELVSSPGGETAFVGNGGPLAMETRAPTSTRVAKLSDITLGAPNTVFGDWLGDGVLNALWLNIGPEPATPFGANLAEVYSIKVGQQPNGNTWAGTGPMPIPQLFLENTDLAVWQPGRAIDVDGDGFADMAFTPNTTFSGNRFVFANRVFYSARAADGTVHPMSRTGASVCKPAALVTNHYSNYQTSTLADMDGDGLQDIVVLANETRNGETSVFAHWMKNRGDGRFGLYDPTDTLACDFHASLPFDEQMPDGYSDLAIVYGNVSMHDVTGDGLADFVGITAKGLQVCAQERDKQGNCGLWGACESMPANQFLTQEMINTFDPTQYKLFFADMDANGVDDIVVLDSTGYFHPLTLFTARPNLLNSITTSSGALTSLTYDTTANLSSAARYPGHAPWTSSLPR